MNRTPILGCIADDFTGASDLASFLLKGGLRVVQINGVPKRDEALTEECDAVVIALKSRTCPAEHAIEQSIASLEWLQNQQCSRFYFKYCSTFDSSEKGNIGPVIDALMAELKVDSTLVCPALPVNGRTVYHGNLFVNGQPLAESPMANHPLTPMHDSNVLRLLSQQVKPEYADQCSNIAFDDIQRAGDSVLSSSGRYWVTDTIQTTDLQILSKQFATRDNFPLLTGGSGLAEFIGSAYAKAGWLNTNLNESNERHQNGPVLILSGSCSEATRKQIDVAQSKLATLQIDPLAIDKSEQSIDTILKWLDGHSGQSVLIYSSAVPTDVQHAQQKLGEQRASTLIEQCMANIASAAVKHGYYQKLVVAGGETSGAVVSELKLRQFRVGQSIAPGVPLLYCESDIILALKSGNFGRPEFFLDSIESMS